LDLPEVEISLSQIYRFDKHSKRLQKIQIQRGLSMDSMTVEEYMQKTEAEELLKPFETKKGGGKH